jgi:hypothetical protein
LLIEVNGAIVGLIESKRPASDGQVPPGGDGLADSFTHKENTNADVESAQGKDA